MPGYEGSSTGVREYTNIHLTSPYYCMYRSQLDNWVPYQRKKSGMFRGMFRSIPRIYPGYVPGYIEDVSGVAWCMVMLFC